MSDIGEHIEKSKIARSDQLRADEEASKEAARLGYESISRERDEFISKSKLKLKELEQRIYAIWEGRHLNLIPSNTDHWSVNLTDFEYNPLDNPQEVEKYALMYKGQRSERVIGPDDVVLEDEKTLWNIFFKPSSRKTVYYTDWNLTVPWKLIQDSWEHYWTKKDIKAGEDIRRPPSGGGRWGNVGP